MSVPLDTLRDWSREILWAWSRLFIAPILSEFRVVSIQPPSHALVAHEPV